MPLAFEQQPKESDKAFDAFTAYLNLGAKRSLALAAKRLHKGKKQLERWSTKYDWPARVRAHSAHLAAIQRETAEALARANGVDWAKRQEEQLTAEWKARSEALQLAYEAINRWKQNPNKCGTLEGIARLLDLASKLGRLASGMPTDHTEVTTQVQGKIDIEWENALKRVYGKANPAPAQVIDVDAKRITRSAAVPAAAATDRSAAVPAAERITNGRA